MGLFGSIKNAITGPFRAVGQLVQGKPRGFLGALGDTVKPAAVAASAIPGPHQGLTIPLAAAGGAMQKFDDEGDRGFGQILMGGAKGAGMAAGARLIPGAVDKFGSVTGLYGGAGGGATAVAPGMAEMMAAGGGAAAPTTAATPAAGGGFGAFLKGNAPYLAQGMGAAATVYGAHEQGRALDEQLMFERERETERMKFEREREAERQRQNQIGMLLQAMSTWG